MVVWFIIHSNDKPNCFTNALIVIYVSVFCFCLSFRYISLIFYRIIGDINYVDCITNGAVRDTIKQDTGQLDDFRSIRWPHNQHQKRKKNFPYYLPRYDNRQKRRHTEKRTDRNYRSMDWEVIQQRRKEDTAQVFTCEVTLRPQLHL